LYSLATPPLGFGEGRTLRLQDVESKPFKMRRNQSLHQPICLAPREHFRQFQEMQQGGLNLRHIRLRMFQSSQRSLCLCRGQVEPAKPITADIALSKLNKAQIKSHLGAIATCCASAATATQHIATACLATTSAS